MVTPYIAHLMLLLCLSVSALFAQSGVDTTEFFQKPDSSLAQPAFENVRAASADTAAAAQQEIDPDAPRSAALDSSQTLAVPPQVSAKEMVVSRKPALKRSLLELEPADTALIMLSHHASLPLSLDDAIALAIAANPDIAGARLEWLANRYTANAAWGIFEPSLAAGYRYIDQHVNYSRYPFDTTRFNGGVEGLLPSGAKYNVAVTYSGSPGNSTFYARPQAYTGASLTQPLLKGTWSGSPLVQRKRTVLEREIALHSYRARLIDILYQVESAYWTLSFAQERYRSAVISVAIARKLVIDSKERLRAGKMSLLDVTEADAGLAARLGEMEDARQGLLESISRLKMLLSADDIGKGELIGAVSPLFIDSTEIARGSIVDSVTDRALALQPEYLVRGTELKKAALEVGNRLNQCLPQLDVSGSYGFVGSGTTTEEAFNKLFNEGLPSWSVEAQMRIELLGTQSRNVYKAEKMRFEIAQKNYDAIGYQLHSTLRILAQRIAAQQERMQNARTVVDFRERILEVEFSRLGIGKSNYRLIFEAEEKLAQARQEELENRTRCRITLLEMAKTSGKLLRDLQLETVVEEKPVLIDELQSEEPWNQISKSAPQNRGMGDTTEIGTRQPEKGPGLPTR